MILIYTGKAKGKTSACIGQTVRALGQNLRVGFAQFMKRDNQAGEQRILHSLLGEHFFVGGLGFFRDKSEKEAHREAVLRTLVWAKNGLVQWDMLILDESLYALQAELLERAELEDLLQMAEAQSTHVVLSGRGLPTWLQEKAHLVTEMVEIKHPWQQGIAATVGIEF